MEVTSIIMLIQSHNTSPKPQVLVPHPHTTLFSNSREVILLSIDISLKYPNIQNFTMDLREKERPHS